MQEENLSEEEYLRKLQREEATHRGKISKDTLLKYLEERPGLIDTISQEQRKKTIDEIAAASENLYGMFDKIIQTLAQMVKESASKAILNKIENVCVGSLNTYNPNGWVIPAPNGKPIIILHNGIFGLAHDSTRFLASFLKSEDGQVSIDIGSPDLFIERTHKFMYSCLHFLTDGRLLPGKQFIELDQGQTVASVMFRDAYELFILCHEYGHIVLDHLNSNNLQRSNHESMFYKHPFVQEFEADRWSQEFLLNLNRTLVDFKVPSMYTRSGGIIALSSILALEKCAKLFPLLEEEKIVETESLRFDYDTHPPTHERRKRLLDEYFSDSAGAEFIVKIFDYSVSIFPEIANMYSGLS